MDITRSENGQRQPATVSIMWEMKPKTTPQKTSAFLMGPEQVKRPEIIQVV